MFRTKYFPLSGLALAGLFQLAFAPDARPQNCNIPTALPYQEAFNGLPSGTFPQCVTTLNVSGVADGNWTTGSLTGTNFTAPSAFVNTVDAGPYDAWLFLPLMQFNAAESYRVEYRYGTNSGSTGANNRGRLSVWYGTSPTAAAMTNAIVDHGEFSHPALNTHTDFTPGANGNYYIGFRVDTDPFTRMVGLDDISVGPSPVCLEPSNLVANGPGFTDVQLTWDCDDCDGPFIVEYGPASVFIAPGNGTTPANGGVIASTTAMSPFFLDGLAMGENYRVFVRQNCPGGVGGNSPGTTFSTSLGNMLCGSAATLSCDEPMAGATHQSFELPDLTNYCDQNLFNTKGVWYRVEGNGGEFTVSTSPANGGWTIGNPNLIMFTGNCGDQQCLAFSPWSATEQGSTIVWTTAPNTTYYLYVYGDNTSFQLSLECEDAPNCFPPTGIALNTIGTNTASFLWTNSDAPEYGYEVRTSGAAGSGPTGLVASGSGISASPLPISGLQPNTSYTLYVRGICGPGDPSAWAALAFKSLCLPADVPYDGGFSDAQVPECYRVVDLNGGNSWYSAPNPGQYQDAFVARYGVSPGAPMADDWLITQGVNTVAGSTYRITYRYSVISAIYPERMAVYHGNGATPGELTTLLANHPVITNNHNNIITNSVDISPGTGVLYVGFHVTSESNGWQLSVGDIRIELVPTCLPPDGVEVTGITQTGATIGWQAAAGAVGYEYEVRTGGLPGSGATGLASSGATTSVGTTLAGLLVNSTTYNVYVRSDCGPTNGWSTWSDAVPFNTQCPATTVPYSEDFTGIPNGEIPLCFSRATPGQVSPEGWGRWVASTLLSGTAYQLPAAEVVTVENLNYDAWLFTQGLQLTGGVAYRLTYRYGTNSNSMGQDNEGRMAVWLGETPEIADMTQLVIDHGTFSGIVFNASVDFVPPSTGNWYIGYRVASAPNTRRVVLDDILVDLAPTCMEPTDVVVLSGAGSTVQVNWECTGCPGEFIVEYGPASVFTTPGTDDQAGPFGTISSSNATSPHFITGLATGENYRIFVRQVCTGDDYSLPSPAVEVTTPLSNGFCGQALPLVCGGNALGATSNAPVWPNIQDFCGFNPYQTTGVWYRITGNGGTYTVSSCPEDGGANLGVLELIVLEGSCNNFVCVARSGTITPGCNGSRVEWDTQVGTQYFIWAIGNSASFTLAAACLAPPACPLPTGLALAGLEPNAAQFTWTLVSGDTYDHEVRTSGLPGSGNPGLVASGNALVATPLNVTGLEAATDHTLYLRRNCTGEGVSSDWVPFAFRTSCDPTDVPYSGAFMTNEVPPCFRVVDVASNGTWQAHAFTMGGYTDPFIARIGDQPGTAKDDWLITQGLNTQAGASYRLTYKRSVISALYGERLSVFYGNAPVVSAMTELLLDHGTITNSVPQETEIEFTPGPGPVYIGFRAYSLASGWQLYVGDIRVDLASACGAPTALATLDPPNSVQVDWSCPGCTGTYFVEYGSSGFVPGTGSVAGEGTLEGPFSGTGTLIQGLSGDLSTLQFVVRRDCSGDGTTFSTNSAPVSPLDATAVSCSGALDVSWCYGNNEDSFHRYVGDSPIVLRFTGGTPQSCCDFITVYDGPNTTSPVLFSGNDLGGVEVGSTNVWNMLTLRVVSDAGSSCADGSTGPLTWNVLCGAVGMEGIDLAGVALFPNPTSGSIHLRFDDPITHSALVQIVDLSGRSVFEQVLPVNTSSSTMDLSSLHSGPYLMRMTTRKGTLVHRFQLIR